MQYSNGNYEAFARPRKTRGIDNKRAFLIGSGLASLSAATFLIRDGYLPGTRITIFEELSLPGGALDGACDPTKGFIIRGGREMENHFECLWDMYRSIPSLEIPGASVLDEFYWLNKDDPNFSAARIIENCGQDVRTDGKFTLSDASLEQIVKLCLTNEDRLNNVRINQVFSPEFFTSNFWLYWRTMFAFEEWHSAMEMRRYLMRFVHHVDGLPDLSALKFTKYNQFESLVMPLVSFLKHHGVNFIFDATVTDIVFEMDGNGRAASSMTVSVEGDKKKVDIGRDTLLFITNGSLTESTTYGDQKTAAVLDPTRGGSWQLWRNLAKKSPDFGRPDKFCDHVAETCFASATVTTLDDAIPPFIKKISHRDPFSGRVVTGGIVSVKDSGWLLSYTLNRQPHFKAQPKGQLVVWIYGLFYNRPGNFVRKPMKECSGQEICQEWLYHMGVPIESIPAMAENSANTVPCLMPYVMSYFMPRAIGDRPLVVPEGAINFAFIGNFAETARDTVFTTEYSVRTAMEAVYTLLGIERAVPEVYASCFDIREVVKAASTLLDGRKLEEVKVPFILKQVLKRLPAKTKGTIIHDLLEENGLI